MHKNIIMLGTFDTKGREIKYLYDELQKRGVDVTTMNAGVMGSTGLFPVHISAEEVALAARELGTPEEKSVLLQHMLLSHHGEPEFGAAVRPMCAEAEMLNLIDLMDSRMEIYRDAFEEVEPGQFTKRIFALDKKVYRHF